MGSDIGILLSGENLFRVTASRLRFGSWGEAFLNNLTSAAWAAPDLARLNRARRAAASLSRFARHPRPAWSPFRVTRRDWSDDTNHSPGVACSRRARIF